MNPIIDKILNKVMIEKAMGREMAGEDILEEIEKSFGSAPVGEIRTWSGVEYIKTPKGWRRKPKGFKEKKPAETEKPKESLVDMINRKLREGHAAVKDDMHADALKIAGAKDDKKKNDDWKVTPKSVTDKFKVGDHVMYAGKEMILTRISKDGRFQNGIEMKFANEGDKTPTGSTTKVGNMQYAKPVGGERGEKKGYASMDIKEAKKELVGKKITFKEYFSDGRGGYKDGEGEIKNVRLYGKEKQPIAEIDFPNGDSATISLDQLDKRQAIGYKIEFDNNQ